MITPSQSTNDSYTVGKNEDFKIQYELSKRRLKFVLKENCRKFIFGLTKHLKKLADAKFQLFFQKKSHTEKPAVVLPTILLKDKF